MSNELQIFETDVLTVSEKTELSNNIDNLINTHKNNRQEINRLVFESVAAMTEASDAAALLSRKCTLSRWIGGITGTNQKLQNTINKNRSAVQYAMHQILQKLAEQNLMSFDLITAVNNKLNASLNYINAELVENYERLAKIAKVIEGLKIFFRNNRNELMKMEGQLNNLKKEVKQTKQDVNLLKWQNSIEYQDFNGTEYERLDDAAKISCLARDFYEITRGNWSDSDLLLLKTAMATIDIPPRNEINYFSVIERIANDKLLKDKYLGGGQLLQINEPDYLITTCALRKMEAYQNEERNSVAAFAELLKEHGIGFDLNKIRANLTKKYLKEEAHIDADTSVECYDMVLDLLFNLKGAKAEGLLVNDKIGPVTAEELIQEADKYYENMDYNKAYELYLLSAEMGLSLAQYNVGIMYNNGEGVYQDFKEAFNWYNKAAEQGLAEAQYALAIMYGMGEGIYQDPLQAFQWCQKAAEQGYAEAQFQLGNLYDAGEGVAQNKNKAFDWYRKSAEQGHADAQCILGIMYSDGDGVQKDKKQAFDWFKKAAEQGSVQAQLNLGLMFYQGVGVQKNNVKTVEWFTKAAEQGNVTAQFQLGMLYSHGDGVRQDYNKALEWFMKAAEQGDADAQFNIGILYNNGNGMRQDSLKAFEWFKKAAEQGHARAQYFVGSYYYIGKGVQQDYIKAYAWFIKAAEQGDADAQLSVAYLYYFGQGLEQDTKSAFEWFRKAAEQGLLEAQNHLASMYAKGEGIQQNKVKAFEWFRKAAEQGLPEAQNNLASMYAKGEGIQQNEVKAFEWYQKAAEQGLDNAQLVLGLAYLIGKDIKQDKNLASYWLQKAAEQGNAKAEEALNKFF